MFQRAIITDEVSQQPREAIELSRRFGLDGIEIRSAWEKRPHEFSQADVDALRTMSKDAGLAVCAVATPCFKCAVDDPAAVRTHFEMLRRCLDVCIGLGTSIARVFSFWAQGDRAGGSAPSAESARAAMPPVIADHLARAADVAQTFGCRLGVENEPSVLGSNGRRVAELLARVRHPALGAVWDPGNDLYDPSGEQPYPEGYLHLHPYLLHVHIKDAKRDLATGSAQTVPLGDGEVPYSHIFTTLIEDGYAGFVSLETHYRIARPLSAEAALMPSGSAFSAGGLEASTLCLQRWQALLTAAGIAAPLNREN